MNKKIIYSLVTAGVLSGTVAGGLFYATKWIDPETLKSEIISQVKKKTGRDLTITGNLHWSFFPQLGIEVSGVSLSNRQGFSPANAATFKTLKLDIALMPLIFKRDFILDDILVEEGVIYLTTHANGQNNWDDLLGAPKSSSEVKETSKDNTSDSSVQFNIATLDISNSSVIWDDQAKNQHWQLTELSVNGDDIALNQAFPIKIQGKFADAGKQLKSQWNIDTHININLDKKEYILTSLDLSGDVEGASIPNGKQKISVSLSKIKFNEINKELIIEKLGVDGFGSYVTGDLTAAISQKTSGKFHIDKVALSNFKITDIVIPVKGDKGVYHLAPITGKLYGGNINASINVNTNPDKPQWNIDYKLSNLQLHDYLAEEYATNRFSGTAHSNGQLSTSGLSSDEILASLSGATHFEVVHGVLNGIDINYWWEVGNQLLKANPTTAITHTNTQKTEIAEMSANFSVNHGIASTNDLQLYNQVIFVKGQGQINLVNNTVNMKLFVSKNKNGEASGTTIPLILSGPLGDASIKVDEVGIATLAAKSAGKALSKNAEKLTDKAPEALKKPLNNMVNKLLGQ